jgi:anthranilate/para-aminobenzoate synthase component I
MSLTSPDSQLLELAGRLPPPWILFEDGLGKGTRMLAWGAAERLTIPWSEAAVGSLEAFNPGDGWFGAIGYDLGLPPGAARRRPMLEQPLVDLFKPRNRITVSAGGGPLFLGPQAESEWLQGRSKLEEVSGRKQAADREDPVPSGLKPLSSSSFTLPLSSFGQSDFEEAVGKALEYIRAGDIYQANLSVAHRVAVRERPFDIYRRLRAINPSPWMGMADFGDWQLISGSPELLVDVRDGQARARPIAGTRKKTGDAAADAAMRRELVSDTKESAEHVMLVDLARNDLGRVAEYGSVHVAGLAHVSEYSHVMHLESDVACRLAAGLGPLDAFKAMFPGGTITGCPKIRAMEIIAELEPVARGMYTGALGWWEGGAGQWNILIRSAVVRGGEAVIQAGAGIVADSVPEREWKESLRKAAAMREAFGE